MTMNKKEESKYVLAHGERDSLPYFLSVRKDFYECSNKEELQWFLEIKIYFDSTETGLANQEEDRMLNKFEDVFDEKVQVVGGVYFVGRITWNGVRSLFYYVENPELISELLNKIIKEGQYLNEFEYKIDKDPEWQRMSEIIPNVKEI
jgi:hypothetical protein